MVRKEMSISFRVIIKDPCFISCLDIYYVSTGFCTVKHYQHLHNNR